MASLPGGRATEPDPRRDAYAAREPYFSVLTAPAFLRANMGAEEERAFFRGGETLVDAIFTTIELQVAPHFAPTAVLEYGCGPGRLAMPLARRAARRGGKVTAVDRLPAMLAAARAHAIARGLDNITFESADFFWRGDSTFDFLSCYFVLQRLAPRDGLDLLGHLLDRLRPGGIAAIQFPHRTDASAVVSASRGLRARLPLVNRLANVLRGKPSDEPFDPSYVYPMEAVLRVFEDARLAHSHLVLDTHAGLGSALLIAERPLAPNTRHHQAAALAPATGAPPTRLDASGAAPPGPAGAAATDHTAAAGTAVVATPAIGAATTLEDLIRSADEYYATLADWTHHLAKPFATAEDAPTLLTDVAVVLQGVKLRPGLTVLEFGAGTGWMSRILTQLGCRAILLDVSPTALRIAEDLYRRVPVVGTQPAPVFLEFDGRHIALPDASVDRVICLHAFHHAPNPDDVIAELGRILKPGGIAGFAEPGPQHSQSAKSQFEMRTYGVVERDVDVHAIWATARACGFADMTLAAFHGLPFQVTLAEYEDLLAGGPTSERWTAETRVFLRNVRSFFLLKEGAAGPDSHHAEGLACEIHADPPTGAFLAGRPIVVRARVTNAGSARWLPADAEHGSVALGAHLYDAAGGLVSFDVCAAALTQPPRPIEPGETVTCAIELPGLSPGRHIVELDCVSVGVMWMSQLGSRVERVTIDVE